MNSEVNIRFFSPSKYLLSNQPLNASTMLKALTKLLLLNFHSSPCERGIHIFIFQHKEIENERGPETADLATSLNMQTQTFHTVLLWGHDATAPFQELITRHSVAPTAISSADAKAARELSLFLCSVICMQKMALSLPAILSHTSLTHWWMLGRIRGIS